MRKYLLALLCVFAAALAGAVTSGTIVAWTGQGPRHGITEFEINSSAIGSAADFIPGTAGVSKVGTTSLYLKDVISSRHGFAVALSTIGVVPDYAGQMSINQAYEVLIATSGTVGSWTKVGAQ